MDVSAFADPATQAAATYLVATLNALAREERVGRRPRRLLEPALATWERFRGRLGARDLAELLLEDAAVTQPQPFDARGVLGGEGPFEELPDALVERWMMEVVSATLDSPLREYVEQQAKHLGLAARPAFADLPRLQPHHRVLELPGSGGRLAAHIVDTQAGIFLKDVFTIACATWQEQTLAGLVAVAHGVVGDVRIVRDPEVAADTLAGYTHVIGLRPEKGGQHSAEAIEAKGFLGTVVLV